MLPKKVTPLNLLAKLISLVTVFLFQVPAGVSSGAPSSSSSTIETVDPGLKDYFVPVGKAKHSTEHCRSYVCNHRDQNGF